MTKIKTKLIISKDRIIFENDINEFIKDYNIIDIKYCYQYEYEYDHDIFTALIIYETNGE